jgi:hypothetical protein
MSRTEHIDELSNYLLDRKDLFLLTIARDGELPVRSMYFYRDKSVAFEAYERYTNFGFAKEFLDVCLYEPTGEDHKKTLKRPPAGECSYVRENYVKARILISSFKNTISQEEYSRLIEGFALIFSQDNIRFNSERFFEELNYKKGND